jgi:hypothetical protein
MATHPTEWVDEWIVAEYPDALFFTDSSGEVGVMLGQTEEGKTIT